MNQIGAKRLQHFAQTRDRDRGFQVRVKRESEARDSMHWNPFEVIHSFGSDHLHQVALFAKMPQSMAEAGDYPIDLREEGFRDESDTQRLTRIIH